MKVLVCDYAGISAQWIEQYAIKENLEVVGTITPETDSNSFDKNAWEYLLIFEQGARNFFSAFTQFMKIPENRVVYALDLDSWAAHPAAMYALLNPAGGVAYRTATFNVARQLNPYVSCSTVDNVHYIATSKDNRIMNVMYTQHKNWAEDEMKIFHMLAKKFYDVDDSEGLFLDLGANIGTTGIYFTKKIAPNLKLLAFEPDPENFKMLRINLMLNDLERKAITVNCGLGAEESEATMYKMPENPGANGMYWFKEGDGRESEIIKIIPLDKYFSEHDLSAKDVKYIWIDTEGFEAQILQGMKNILAENPAPLFMEFNPKFWTQSGHYEKMMNLVRKFYKGWIWVKETTETGKSVIRPIEHLKEFQTSGLTGSQLGDIFLVHDF